MVKRLKGIMEFSRSKFKVQRVPESSSLELGTLNVELLFFFQRAPDSLRCERGLANAYADGAVDGISDIGRHRIQRGFSTAFGAIGTDAVLVLYEVKFDFFRQI